MSKKTPPMNNKVKTTSSTRKPVQKTNAYKTRALEEQLAQRDAEIARLSNENQLLIKEKDQRATELQIINNISQTLTKGGDLNSMIQRVGERIQETLNVKDIIISVLDEKTSHVLAPYMVRNGKQVKITEENFDLRTYKFMMRASARGGGRSWVVNTNAEKGWRKSFILNDDAPKSFVTLPLLAGKEVIGGITIADFERENAFSDISVSLLETIASNMGTAVQNVRLFDETQRLLKETEQRATELQIINNIGQTLTDGLDLNLTLERVGERLLASLMLKIFGIVVFDPKSESGISHYLYVKGKRVNIEHFSIEKFKASIRLSLRGGGRSWVVNTNAEKVWRKYGAYGDEIAKSFVMLPLLAGKEVIGGITILDYERENAFTDLPISLIETIASNMGTAIQNVRLFEETQRLLKETEQRATELQIINNIGQTLTEGGDLNSMIQRVGDRLREALKVKTIGISVWDEKIDNIIARYYYRNGKPAVSTWLASDVKVQLRLSARGGNRSWVVNRNAEKSWRKFGGLHETDAPKSFAQLPLLAGGKLVGGIGIADYEKEDAFIDLPIRMLETIASNMGTVIQNARLFEETQRLLKETEQRATELQVINNVGQTITGELDLNTLIEHVGDKLREAFNVGDIRIAVVDEKTGLLISPYVYRHGKRVELEENWQEKAKRYKLAMRASARTGLKTWVVNTDAERSWRKFAIVVDDENVPKSFVMLPLLAGKEVIGGITIPDYEKENAFTDFSIGMLETIASNMGTAIQNVRLFNETQRLFEEAEESRAAAEKANKAKSTFLANMSHELRTPLNAIMGFTSIVKGKAEGVLPEKQIGNLEKVLASSQHLLGLINTVLDLAKIEAGRMDVIPAKFNFNVLIDLCANLANPLLKPNVTLEKQVDETVGIIYSDQDKIKQILLNLLSNAAKFTHAGRILLSVEKSDPDTLNISVTDSGIGISANGIDRVFEEFQQADSTTTRQYGGTGLGLPISRNLARLLGGDLTATSELGKGSTFTLTIPTQYGRKLASSSEPQPASIQSTESHTQSGSSQP